MASNMDTVGTFDMARALSKVQVSFNYLDFGIFCIEDSLIFLNKIIFFITYLCVYMACNLK